MPMAISLLPDNPGSWTYRVTSISTPFHAEEREKLQLEAVPNTFARLRNRIPRAPASRTARGRSYRQDRRCAASLLRPPCAQNIRSR